MDTSVWNLPGLHRFAADIAGDLREGRNVLVVCPSSLPPGLHHAISSELANADLGPLEIISAEKISQGSPVYDLHQVYNQAVKTQNGLDIQSLCRCDSFQSRMIWLDDIEMIGEKGGQWLDFLKRYAVACGSQDLIDRTVFAVPIRYHLAMVDLPVENLLAQHWFWGRTSSLDMQLLSAQVIANREADFLENRLLINVVTSLCGFDIESAKAFCRQAFEEETEIDRFFENLATVKAWDLMKISEILSTPEVNGAISGPQSVHKPGSDLATAWMEGILDLVDGRVVISPAAEAARANKEELRLRLWRGHVQTLLPVIDEYRIQLLRHLKTNNPSLLKTGKNNFKALEIGELKYLIETDARLRRKVDKDLRSLVRLLAKIRNDLAHLKPVSKERRLRMVQAVRTML